MEKTSHYDKDAAVALLLTCGDGEERAEVYGCAADRQQASIVFNVATDMVRMCTALSTRVKISLHIIFTAAALIFPFFIPFDWWVEGF